MLDNEDKLGALSKKTDNFPAALKQKLLQVSKTCQDALLAENKVKEQLLVLLPFFP